MTFAMALRRARPSVAAFEGLRRPVVAAALAFVIASPVGAQAPRWEVDLSGSRIEYDTAAALNAPSLSTLAEWQRPSLFGRMSASVTGFEGAGWSMQGRGDLAGWLAPFGATSPVRFELAGTLGGSRHSRGFDSYVARGDARLHLRGRRVGVWGGASLSSSRNSFDTAAVTGVVPAAGLWAQGGPVRATLSYMHTRMLDETYPEANVALALTRGPLDLTVYGGHRISPFDGEGLDETWGGAAAAIWLLPHAALLVSGGKYGSDLFQGLPGGQFVSIGIRLTPRRSRPVPISAPAPIVYTAEAARTGSIGFQVEGATRVEIAGDWNGWQPTPLSRDGSGRWIVPADLEPGVYRFNLRVDGERWIVPDGVAQIDDGFGDRVGLLIISAQE
ncbi:MAG TPA: glycogen-binding domain-containing protein [Candidatus Limnocylindrales bacterium]|nr:glycogen-binding domain-containing protein [Candidatus Limnocylindrales bacterium]